MTVASFIAAQRADHGVPHAKCCRWLGVKPSTFYTWWNRPPTPTEQRRERLDAAVRESFDEVRDRIRRKSVPGEWGTLTPPRPSPSQGAKMPDIDSLDSAERPGGPDKLSAPEVSACVTDKVARRHPGNLVAHRHDRPAAAGDRRTMAHLEPDLVPDEDAVRLLDRAAPDERPALMATLAADPDPTRRAAVAPRLSSWQGVPDDVLAVLAADHDVRVRRVAAAVAAATDRSSALAADPDWRVAARAVTFCNSTDTGVLDDGVLARHRALAESVALADIDAVLADAPASLMEHRRVSRTEQWHTLFCTAPAAGAVMVDPRTKDPLPAARVLLDALYATRHVDLGPGGMHATYEERDMVLGRVAARIDPADRRRAQRLRGLLRSIPRRIRELANPED
ncbi:MAG: hypothetical protein FJW94_14460 [Actinobacteria bacterium]|nr:hypothetical protein [Actinomycetota bacterium]